MIMANGRALAMVMVCKALSPPASNSTAATAPSSTAQNTRCHAGVLITPPEARESITSEPESDEVTKKVMISNTVRREIKNDQGSTSRSEERRVGKECRSRGSPDHYSKNEEQ